MFYKEDQHKNIIGVLLALLFLSTGCQFGPTQLFPEQTIDPLPLAIDSRNITDPSNMSLVWQQDNIQIRNHLRPSPGIVAGHGQVAFVNFLGGPLSTINQLNLLDAKTGTTLWQSERFGDHEAIAISNDKAITLLNEGSQLNIYDTTNSDNRPAISLNSFKEPAHFFLFPPIIGEDVLLYFNQGQEYSVHHLNLDGEEISSPQKIQVPTSLSMLYLFERPFMLIDSGRQYTWADFETGKELWHFPSTGRTDSWPLLKNDILYISPGDGKRYEHIALDAANGQELWRTSKEYGSNLVWYKGSLYALRNDAVLVKLNPKTGQVEEEIPFYPASIDAGQWAYWLASDGERLFIYFGDSQELFALDQPQ